MEMNQKIQIGVLFLLMVLSFCGCSKKQTIDKTLEEGYYRIYMMNNTQSGLSYEEYKAEAIRTDDLILELLSQMSYEPSEFQQKYAINENVILKDHSFNEGILTLDFDSMYQNQDAISEALVRASIVKTLAQIDAVDYVEFYVNGTPLNDSYDKPIGQMAADDFIDDDDVEGSCLPAEFSIYFASEDGEHLVECTESTAYYGSRMMEQLILSHLIEGPDQVQKEAGLRAAVPENTIVNNITTKEGVCYVDFSKEFLEPVEGVNENVSIYAVVNSLVELSNINKVQIMIDGKIVENYRDSIALDDIFDRNLDLVEGAK